MILPKVIFESRDILVSSFKGPQGGSFNFSSGGYPQGDGSVNTCFSYLPFIWLHLHLRARRKYAEFNAFVDSRRTQPAVGIMKAFSYPPSSRRSEIPFHYGQRQQRLRVCESTRDARRAKKANDRKEQVKDLADERVAKYVIIHPTAQLVAHPDSRSNDRFA